MSSTSLVGVLAFSCAFYAAVSVTPPQWERHDVETLNGHPGYMTAWNRNGPLDRVVVCVAGYLNPSEASDVEQYYTDRPPLAHMVDEYAPQGWDVIIFNYQNPGIDIRQNAENLQHFLRFLREETGEDAYVGVWGWSMGNLVVRTAFAQANSSMGVNTFVSLDGPHHGMQVSKYARSARSRSISRHDFPAVRQQTVGEQEKEELLDRYLPSLETEEFIQEVIDPIHTQAITFSDGSKPWTTRAVARTVHDKFWPVCSYVGFQGLPISEFIVYHSAAFMDNTETEEVSRGGAGLRRTYRYKYHGEKPSRYFDSILPFPRGPHNLAEQADSVPAVMRFIAQHAPLN